LFAAIELAEEKEKGKKKRRKKRMEFLLHSSQNLKADRKGGRGKSKNVREKEGKEKRRFCSLATTPPISKYSSRGDRKTGGGKRKGEP